MENAISEIKADINIWLDALFYFLSFNYNIIALRLSKNLLQYKMYGKIIWFMVPWAGLLAHWFLWGRARKNAISKITAEINIWFDALLYFLSFKNNIIALCLTENILQYKMYGKIVQFMVPRVLTCIQNHIFLTLWLKNIKFVQNTVFDTLFYVLCVLFNLKIHILIFLTKSQKIGYVTFFLPLVTKILKASLRLQVLPILCICINGIRRLTYI